VVEASLDCRQGRDSLLLAFQRGGFALLEAGELLLELGGALVEAFDGLFEGDDLVGLLLLFLLCLSRCEARTRVNKDAASDEDSERAQRRGREGKVRRHLAS